MMKVSDKLILVHYIGIGNMDNSDVPEYIQHIVKALQPKVGNEEEVLSYYIPTREESRIECINPKLLTVEDFKETNDRLYKAQRDMFELLGILKEND